MYKEAVLSVVASMTWCCDRVTLTNWMHGYIFRRWQYALLKGCRSPIIDKLSFPSTASWREHMLPILGLFVTFNSPDFFQKSTHQSHKILQGLRPHSIVFLGLTL
ncbi:hypothetical protein NP493_469g03019 [Ridgeia piscesae]|uniref:Uncharacterized protein n=1 Tax=Ridgeia piscesae TaxID=27915 RepID=A0AAD9NT98_RIDPI|nr:hypothetical protein NP493_469g03019 [Ridgeia piscesae]